MVGRTTARDEPAIDKVANIACEGEGGFLRRCKGAEGAMMMIHPDPRCVLAIMLHHALEARLIA
jgi:hypothetical protein